MVKVVGVRFKRAGKVYYFDPGEFELAKGVQVIVETARGIEFGETVGPAKEVAEEELATPLKKVIRIASEADAAQLRENEAREKEAFAVAARKISEHNPEMDLVDVEYTFDGNKIIFYFTAEGRVDFRDLVRDLAAVFRTRIELRQIGVRDEAKMLGGIGPCGRALCCTTFLGDFAPVSIKMAKEQNLSLNPTKISGLCGRLLCCLRYESEHYERAKAAFPTVGTPVSTKDGDGRVAAVNVIKGVISVEFPTGVTHDYPADAVRSQGKPGQPAAAPVSPEGAEASGEPPVSDEAAPVTGEQTDASVPPCAGCAAGEGCPRAEAEQEALKDDAVLVAEAVPTEGETPVVRVFEGAQDDQQPHAPAGEAGRPTEPRPEGPRQNGPRPRPRNARRHNRGGHGDRHQSGDGQQPGGSRPAGDHPHDGNPNRGRHRPGGGERSRNDSLGQQSAGSRPVPRPRNDDHGDQTGGGPHRPDQQ